MKNRKYRKAIIAGILIVLILIFWPDATNSSKIAFREISTHIEKTGSDLGKKSIGFIDSIQGLGGSAEREKYLSLELVRVQSELNQLRNIESENLRLRKALGFKESASYKLTAGSVISRNISGWWNTIRIEPGANKNIKANQAVLNANGLIGKTYQINRSSTEVLLLSDPSFRVAAKLSGYGVFGVVKGMGIHLNGRPSIHMEFINKDIKIKEGTKVVTAGFQNKNEFFPADIPIGYINKIYQDESGLYQYAEIIPYASSGLLDYLFISTKGEEGL